MHSCTSIHSLHNYKAIGRLDGLTCSVFVLLGTLQRLKYIAETSGAFMAVYAVRLASYKCSYTLT